jgi:thiazole synthase
MPHLPRRRSTLFILRQEAEEAEKADIEGRQSDDQLVLYGRTFTSRLLLGTARYASPSLLAGAIRAAAPAMLTMSLRRQVSGSRHSGQSFWDFVRDMGRTILPNRAGCFTASEAVKTACLARELFQSDLMKLEVMGMKATSNQILTLWWTRRPSL